MKKFDFNTFGGGYLHSMAVHLFISSGRSLKMRCSAGLAVHSVRSPTSDELCNKTREQVYLHLLATSLILISGHEAFQYAAKK